MKTDTQVIQIELTPYELEELDKALGSKTREETIKSAINLGSFVLTVNSKVDTKNYSPRRRGHRFSRWTNTERSKNTDENVRRQPNRGATKRALTKKRC